MPSVIELDDLDRAFHDTVTERLPLANFDLCLTCGTCAGGCPASAQFDMDPRKLVRMLAYGLDEEVMKTPWAWVCTMCARCYWSCPMKVDIPKLVYQMRQSWPRDKRPKGIRGSCDQHIRTGNAMGVPTDDFIWTVEDVAEEIRETQPAFKDLQVSVDRKGAKMAINQNSREPVTEPDELSPLSVEDPPPGGGRLDLSLGDVGRGELLPLSGRRRGLAVHSRGVRPAHRQQPGLRDRGQHRVRAQLFRDPGRIAQV